MTAPHAGSCLCDAVRFEVSGVFDSFFLCHCSRCRKGTGSAHAANLFARGAALVWLTGEDAVRTYAVSGSRHARNFCGTCGSAMPQVQFGGALLIVPAGSLDTPVSIRPAAHICCGDRAEWDHDLETVPRLDGLPG